MLYGELNLKKIREAANLDFAHYTYKKCMCSCCHSPKNLAKKYWKGGRIPTDKDKYNLDNPEGYTYLLFRNSDNGMGAVYSTDEIKAGYIEWGFPMEKLPLVCNLLQQQLGSHYQVVEPDSMDKCIVIKKIIGIAN